MARLSTSRSEQKLEDDLIKIQGVYFRGKIQNVDSNHQNLRMSNDENICHASFSPWCFFTPLVKINPPCVYRRHHLWCSDPLWVEGPVRCRISHCYCRLPVVVSVAALNVVCCDTLSCSRGPLVSLLVCLVACMFAWCGLLQQPGTM